jgi:cytochrome P450
VLWTALLFVRSAVRLVYAEVPEPVQLLGDYTTDFGGGVHYCLGANLARRELAEALKILARRLPNPRRLGSAPWKPLLGMSGPTSLTIQFG